MLTISEQYLTLNGGVQGMFRHNAEGHGLVRTVGDR